jgi:hypothetical protein
VRTPARALLETTQPRSGRKRPATLPDRLLIDRRSAAESDALELSPCSVQHRELPVTAVYL